MKKIISILILVGSIGLGAFTIQSCSTSAMVQAKSGAQLWGENCKRCHNIASPSDYSDVQWDVIGTHMRLRANLTADEIRKIVEFLQSAN